MKEATKLKIATLQCEATLWARRAGKVMSINIALRATLQQAQQELEDTVRVLAFERGQLAAALLQHGAMENLIDEIAERGTCVCATEFCMVCKAAVLSKKWIAKENARLDAERKEKNNG